MKSFSKEEIQTLKENKEVLYFYKLPHLDLLEYFQNTSYPQISPAYI